MRSCVNFLIQDRPSDDYTNQRAFSVQTLSILRIAYLLNLAYLLCPKSAQGIIKAMNSDLSNRGGFTLPKVCWQAAYVLEGRYLLNSLSKIAKMGPFCTKF